MPPENNPLLLEFTSFVNKQKNRKQEFAAIKAHLPKRKILSILSFPYEYAFEREFAKTFGVKLVVYNVERNYKIEEAQKFSRSTGNAVMVPISDYKSRYIVPKYTVAMSDLTAGNITFGRVNFTKIGVEQKKYPSPKKFDFIDLDYVDSLSVKNFTEAMALYHEFITPGGILMVTLSLSSYRNWKLTQNKAIRDAELDRKGSDVNRFSYNKLATKRPADNYFSSDYDAAEFGITNNATMYQTMATNIADMFQKGTGVRPFYVNVYKGGLSSHGKIMVRIGIKK